MKFWFWGIRGLSPKIHEIEIQFICFDGISINYYHIMYDFFNFFTILILDENPKSKLRKNKKSYKIIQICKKYKKGSFNRLHSKSSF